MELNIILVVLIIIIIIFAVRNFSLFRNLKGSKNYREIYQAILDKDPDIINKIEEYLKIESNEYLINKTFVLFMYVKLLNDEDVNEIIDKIDYSKILMKDNKYNTRFVNVNVDMIIWTLCCLPRLKKRNKILLVKDKLDKLQDVLSNHVEYKVLYGAFAALNNNIEDSHFLNELVNGEYSGFIYEKQLIALTKRITLAYIASLSKEKKNIEYADELKILSETMIGKNLLMDLEIYEVYK